MAIRIKKKKKSTFCKSLDLTCWMPAESNKHYQLLIYISQLEADSPAAVPGRPRASYLGSWVGVQHS